MFDYQSNTVEPLKEIYKQGVGNATLPATSFGRNINYAVSVSKQISCDSDLSS